MALSSDQIINLVLARCGRREADTYLQAALLTELQMLQQDVLEGGAFLPWFLLTEDETLDLVAEQSYVTLPSDFLREWEDCKLSIYDAAETEDPYAELTKWDFDALREMFPVRDFAKPTYYALTGSRLEFFQTPDTAYTATWRYLARQPVLTAVVTSNAWTVNASDVLVAELGIIAAGRYLKNAEQGQLFAADAARAHQRLLAFDEARKQANRAAERGG